MAIYNTIKMNIIQYQNEPVHIFTNSLNSLYLLNTQIKTSFSQNNHLDKIILLEMVTMLQQRTQLVTIYKVHAHSNISSYEKVDSLAKTSN